MRFDGGDGGGVNDQGKAPMTAAAGHCESWASRTVEQVRADLATGEEGLSADEVNRRLAEFGPNRLPSPRKRSAVVRLLLQFHNILIYVLLISAVVTTLLGHWVDTAVIVGVVVINAIIGFIQEGRAEQAMDAVRRMLSLQATVLRDGRRQVVPAEGLVPGDVVVLISGDRVPADLRLAQVKNLQVEEAILTGESLPVAKETEPVAPDAALADRTCMAFSGTMVTCGQATGIVVATGVSTEIGRISALLAQVEALETPLLRKMAEFARWLTVIIMTLSVAIFVFGLFLRGMAASDMFLAAVAIAVAAIPEGLPAIITIVLALAVQRMARHNAIIRYLPAVETLGSVTVICSDKTGTLTRNELTVVSIATAQATYAVSGSGYDPHGGFSIGGHDISAQDDETLIQALRAAALCNDARLHQGEDGWRVDGDPTEGALLASARKAGLDPEAEAKMLRRMDEIPFESEHRLMATLHHDHHGHGLICVKGAPERLLDLCRNETVGGQDRPIDRERWHRQVELLAEQGQRVLAVATKAAPRHHCDLTFYDIEHDLSLIALFGLMDPPREEAIAAVGHCRQAGIAVKMITGDHARTALVIARSLGIDSEGGAVGGPELDRMSDEELAARAARVNVFARISPEGKLRLVAALQSRGEVVAMTGDGVNDAPALKRADIGVAMGLKGTEAAKEAAKMVLADDNFATIAGAIREGRVVYDNLRKTILFLLATNGGQALAVIVAILFGLQLPVTPVQILWVNLVTAVTLSLALGFERAEPDIMSRPPRPPAEPILPKVYLFRIALVTILMMAAALGLFAFEIDQGRSVETARTAAVNALVMCEVFYLFNARFLKGASFSPAAWINSRPVLISVGLILLFQVLFTYAPFMQHLFHTTDLEAAAWSRAILAGAIVFPIVEAEKWAVRHFSLDRFSPRSRA
jgi:potassium/sodium efflux P-type ATPase